MKKYLILLLTIALSTTASLAQKLGHINGQNLVKHMPEYKVAELQIDTLIQQWQMHLEEQKAQYDALIATIQKQKSSNPATPKALIDKNLEKLAALEQEIYADQELMNEDVQRQQMEKLEPIQQKALVAVQSVAKEKGFSYIFDTSTGVLLYLDGEDITALVCAKLGIPDYSAEEKAELEKLKSPTPPIETPPGPVSPKK